MPVDGVVMDLSGISLGDGASATECVALPGNVPLDGLLVLFWSPGVGATAWPLLVQFLQGVVLELSDSQQG